MYKKFLRSSSVIPYGALSVYVLLDFGTLFNIEGLSDKIKFLSYVDEVKS